MPHTATLHPFARRLRKPLRAALLLALALSAAGPFARGAAAQTFDSDQKARCRVMLTSIRDEIRKTYYDPAFHGMDLDARFQQAIEKLDRATSMGQAWGVIAQVLLDLNDSHTFFVPPPRAASIEYGWRMQMVGDACFITAVKKGSDAEAKGVKPGDRVLAIQGFRPNRNDLWKIHYVLYTLNPSPVVKLVLQAPGSEPRQLEVEARFREKKRLVDLTGADGGFDVNELLRQLDDAVYEHKVEKKDGIAIWKMPHFELEDNELDGIYDRVKGEKALVLDLRGNGGGYVDTLESLAGRFVEGDTRIADVRGRKTQKPIVAKKRRGAAFPGKIVVLIDSNSGSASELLARTLQLQQRATVIGDRSAGAVMRAHYYSGSMGTDRVVLYGASVTDADLIMPDGKSLEHVGVVPDEVVLPTADDFAAGADPVLSRAVALLGGTLDPKAAWKMFEKEWK